MAKQLTTAERNRLQRVYKNDDVIDAIREGRDSQVISLGPYDYQAKSAGDGFTQLVRTHRAKGSVKNMGIMTSVVERETRYVKKKDN